jgi:hypothetical protein
MEKPRYNYAEMTGWDLIEIAAARDLPAEPKPTWEAENLGADELALLAEIDKRGLRQ